MKPFRLASSGGSSDLWAGLAGGVFAPLASFGLGLPLWVSLPGAVLVFFGIRLALAPRALFEGVDLDALDAAGLDLAREVLTAAHADIDRLQAAIPQIRDQSVRARLDGLRTVADRVVAEVERKPGRLSSVRRLLTYYLPAAVRLGEGYRVLESANTPDPVRLDAAGAMIARLDPVFGRLADRMSAEEVDGLDVELKLLADSIRTEERYEKPATPEPSPWR